MPVVDPHTGDVLAMATSKKYGTSGRGGTTTLPIFTSYTAQAASTYKLFPLLTALSTGVDPYVADEDPGRPVRVDSRARRTTARSSTATPTSSTTRAAT